MSNLLKAGFVKGGEEKRVIDYNELIQEKLKAIRISLQENGGGGGEFIAGLNAEVVEELVNPEEELEKKREEAEQLLEYAREQTEQARQDAEQILMQARIEGEHVKQQAYEDGRNLGYQDGIDGANQEIDGIRASLVQEKEELERDYEERLRQLEPQLVEVILDVFQKVTYVLAEDRREMMIHLVDRALGRIESSRQFLVRVSKEDYPFVAEHKELIMEKIPSSSEVDIVKDAGLVRNQCLIETDGGVFDCSLDVQLENLIRDIRVLASMDA